MDGPTDKQYSREKVEMLYPREIASNAVAKAERILNLFFISEGSI